jgi:hypothetical protein
MAQVAGPYGLRVVKLIGDLPFSGGMHTFPLTANQTTGYFFGDPVGLLGGQPVPVTVSPTTTAANNVIGVFMGCSYQDPVRGFVNSQFLGANAISNGATNVKLKIADYPHLVMQIQANGSIAATQIGMNAGMIIGAGSIATGNSTMALDSASVAVTATLGLRIYDFVYNASPSPGASSIPGDPFTDVLVTWNFGVHRYLDGLGQ